jgi:hypothetical protein
MDLKDVLLKGLSFNAILNQFSIDEKDVKIYDEELVLARKDSTRGDIFKERILIEGKASNGPIFNFFGTLHYNLLSQLAVFEIDQVEKVGAIA